MPATTPAAERLLAVAADAFYAEGITATGVDTLVARAGVSKPTLYARFGSKANLVTAVLRRHHAERRRSLEDALARHGGPATDRLLAVFDWLADRQATELTRGCVFLNAAAELTDPHDPSREVIASHKRWLRGVFADLLTEAGHPPDRAAERADALAFLADGASSRVAVDGDVDAMRRAGTVAATLLAAWHD